MLGLSDVRPWSDLKVNKCVLGLVIRGFGLITTGLGLGLGLMTSGLGLVG